MPYNSRDPNASGTQNGYQLAVPRSLGVLVLIALVALFALRHVFGSVAVSAGTN
jgi:hypothetical protein